MSGKTFGDKTGTFADPNEAPPAKPKGTKVTDAEDIAVASIRKHLGRLSPSAQARVWRYIGERINEATQAEKQEPS